MQKQREMTAWDRYLRRFCSGEMMNSVTVCQRCSPGKVMLEWSLGTRALQACLLPRRTLAHGGGDLLRVTWSLQTMSIINVRIYPVDVHA